MIGVIAAALVLPVLVHGLAHYAAARGCRASVRFWIAVIPGAGCIHTARRTGELRAWKRVITCLAGPAASYLGAGLLAFAVLLGVGATTGTIWYKIAEVDEDFDAHGKLRAGDRIIAINDYIVYETYGGVSSQSLVQVVQRATSETGGSVDIRVLRAGAEVTATVTPKLIEGGGYEGRDVYYLGVILDPGGDIERLPFPLGDAIAYSVAFPARQAFAFLRSPFESDEHFGPVGVTVQVERPPDWRRSLEQAASASVLVGLFLLLLDLVLVGFVLVAPRLRRRSDEAS